MPRRKTETDQALAAADKAVDDARHRLAEVHAEQRRLAREYDHADAERQHAIHTAAASGSRADVTEHRDTAARIAQELEDLAPVERALADAVTKAEQDRETLSSTATRSWPEWASQVLAKSREVAQEHRDRAVVGLPMAP
jgi:hypothetical protein